MYTFLFLVAIMLSLVLSVFGNSISVVVYEPAPLISKAIHKIIHLRIYFTLPLLTFFWDLWCTSIFQIVVRKERRLFGNNCRAHFLQLAAGWYCPLSFLFIWISLKDLPICMEALQQSFLLCCGYIRVCILFCLGEKSMQF